MHEPIHFFFLSFLPLSAKKRKHNSDRSFGQLSETETKPSLSSVADRKSDGIELMQAVLLCFSRQDFMDDSFVFI